MRALPHHPGTRIVGPIFFFLFLVTGVSATWAAQPATDAVKFRLQPTRANLVLDEPLLAAHQASKLVDYPGYAIVSVPENASAALEDAMVCAGFDASRMDDRIIAPKMTVDPRKFHGSGAVWNEGAGLFVIQYVGYPLPEWHAALHDHGAIEIGLLPFRAAIVAAPSSAVARLRDLPFVQFVDRYDRRYRDALSIQDGPDTYIVQIADVPAASATIRRVSNLGTNVSPEARYLQYQNLRGTFSPAAVDAVLDLPFVVAVERWIPPTLSDERQVLAITGASLPNATNYTTWLGTQGVTPAELEASDIIVDIVDSGLDGGCRTTATRHPDLPSNQAYWYNYNL